MSFFIDRVFFSAKIPKQNPGSRKMNFSKAKGPWKMLLKFCLIEPVTSQVCVCTLRSLLDKKKKKKEGAIGVNYIRIKLCSLEI